MTQVFDKFNPVTEPLNGFTPSEDKSMEYGVQAFDKLFAAAQPGAVFSAPVVKGDITIILTSEVSSGGGFGFGKGFGPAGPSPKAEDATGPVSKEESQANMPVGGGTGMGGGGGASGRPLAVIMIGPDGVRIQPIVDATKIVITALTTFGMIFAAMLKIRRAARKI
ncbi:MAG: hypothetical protein J0I20_06390 [Chloroflexi bacterium]|nr:hypothetical protein [Chloroflexota bacterium]OJV90219.1 MAG: hypothetical protein BGO39_02330 [Chloroflexi bacterium 54-19]